MDVKKSEPVRVSDYLLLKHKKAHIFFKIRILGNCFQHENTENKYRKQSQNFKNVYS